VAGCSASITVSVWLGSPVRKASLVTMTVVSDQRGRRKGDGDQAEQVRTESHARAIRQLLAAAH